MKDKTKTNSEKICQNDFLTVLAFCLHLALVATAVVKGFTHASKSHDAR